jgi:peroxiredoxin
MTVEHQAGEVEVGQTAPDFVARDLDDNEVSLKSLIGGRKALLLFYRGGWCPFCNQQLAAISSESQRFKDAGATIVGVSSEEVEKGKALLKKLSLPFILLSDTNLVGIDRYGVRDPDSHEKLKAVGVTRLSKPAAFVIDDMGVVRYKYVGKNASDRPKNEDLLKAIASS